MLKIMVRRQHPQIVPQAKPRKQRVDCSDLDAGAATVVAQGGRLDMVLSIGPEQRQCRKSLDDVLVRPRAGKALQQFLQDQTGGYDRVAVSERLTQSADFGDFHYRIATKGKRPNARVDKESHERDRSAL